MALADLRHRYAGSALGGLWAIAAPLFEVAAYALVFGALWPPPGGASGLSYAVFIASGLLPWTALREALEASAVALTDNRWIRRSHVPIELLVARQVLVAGSRAVVALVLVAGATLATRGWAEASRALPVLVLATLFLLAACYGVGLLLAPLGTLYPDLRPGLTSVLMFLTFASPILYPESMLPPRLLALIEWNPFTWLLRLYRSPLSGSAGVRAQDIVLSGVAAAVLIGVGARLKDRVWWSARDAL